MADEQWSIEGTLMIACNCDYGCPCNVNGLPTTGKCEGGWTWHVDSGRFGETSLDGLNLSVYADWPGAIHEGGGRAVAFVDERADDDQRQALTTLVRGEAGGPWGVFINTYELEGPTPVPYEVEAAGERSYFRIGSAAELQVEPITNPVTGAEVHPRLLLPEGLLTRDLGLFRSQQFRVEGGPVSYDHSGRYAAVGEFAYAGP
ncbi:MAG TPA: DUF1326 domain-containing protein [Gaiellaceae bacterium]|nr:DUF1326 domain-containing protein [Gaiellaceae bacterium]